MKVRLLYRDRDFCADEALSDTARDLCADLELDQIVAAMAEGDKVIDAVARRVLLHPLTDAGEIRRRQDILTDCIRHPGFVKELYELLTDALEKRASERVWLCSSRPSSQFYGAVHLLEHGRTALTQLRRLADSHEYDVTSEGLTQLFREIQLNLDDEFLRESGQLLNALEMKDGTMIELTLDHEQRGYSYRLVERESKKFHLHWSFAPSFALDPRDMSGVRDLSSRNDRVLWRSVRVLLEASEQIEQFLTTLRNEISFYSGALKLRKIMTEKEIPCCCPEPCYHGICRQTDGLVDLSLALRIDCCVGNSLDMKQQTLCVITGANQGGKTTFLRSIGQAQLMFQSGLYTAAYQFCSHVCSGICSHFNREEDSRLKSGKLDEELQRLDRLIPLLKPGSLVLMNESFSSTNEREASEICRQVTDALLESGIEVFHVTHLYTFARQVWERKDPHALFLRAQRENDGSRSFRVLPGEPSQTAYGLDLYQKIFSEQ